MKKVLCLVLALACMSQAAEIAGKFAFGFEQGIGISDSTGTRLGQGCSFKLCLTNNVAIKGAVGINVSNKISDIVDPSNNDPNTNVMHKEDKARIDYTAAAYGILVFRRFEKVHLNGMTGLLVAFRDNHYKKSEGEAFEEAKTNYNEKYKTLDLHLRILMAPEIFIFPNFSLEYKYGFDVALKKESFPYTDSRGADVVVEKNRLYINTIGDLNLLSSASVHFYF